MIAVGVSNEGMGDHFHRVERLQNVVEVAQERRAGVDNGDFSVADEVGARSLVGKWCGVLANNSANVRCHLIAGSVLEVAKVVIVLNGCGHDSPLRALAQIDPNMRL